MDRGLVNLSALAFSLKFSIDMTGTSDMVGYLLMSSLELSFFSSPGSVGCFLSSLSLPS